MEKKINWHFESSNIKETEWHHILNGFWGFFPFPYLLYLWRIRGADSSHLVLRLQLQSHLLSLSMEICPFKISHSGATEFPNFVVNTCFLFLLIMFVDKCTIRSILK